jgi:hypothetical protein
LGHLLSASPDIVVSDLVQISLLILALNGFSLTVDHSILCHDAEFGRIDFHHFEFHLSHTTANGEEIALSNWAVRFPKIWSEENIEKRTGKTLDRIGDR